MIGMVYYGNRNLYGLGRVGTYQVSVGGFHWQSKFIFFLVLSVNQGKKIDPNGLPTLN